jgi:hypothetical protein
VTIPLGEQLATLDSCAFGDHQAGAVLQSIALSLAADLIDQHELALSIHHHPVIPLLDQLDVVEPDGTFVSRLKRTLRGTDLTNATDVERSHRQLRTGFTDGLRSDDTDRLTDVDHDAARKIAAIAQRTDTAPRLAAEHRANLHTVDPGVVDYLDLLLGDLRIRRHQHFTGVWIDDVFQCDAAEDAVT